MEYVKQPHNIIC